MISKAQLNRLEKCPKNLFFYPLPPQFSGPMIFNLPVALSNDDQIIIPLFWLTIYAVSGTYKNIYTTSRLKEFGQTFLASLVGSLILFFVIILDDEIATYKQYYLSYLTLFSTHFLVTEFFRLILTTFTL